MNKDLKTVANTSNSNGGRCLIRCPNGHKLKASREVLGAMVRCKECQAVFPVTREIITPRKSKSKLPTRHGSPKRVGAKNRSGGPELPHPFHLDRKVMKFGEFDWWTWRMLMTGLYVQGATGGGKSSSILLWLLYLSLRLGAGAIFFTVKGSDCEGYQEIARLAGREQDVVVLDADHEVFNWLDWESKHRQGSFSNNVVELFYALVKLSERGGGEGDQGEAYWKFALKQLVRNAIELLMLAGEVVSLPNMNRIIGSMPSSPEQVRDAQWQAASYCYLLVNRCANRPLNAEDDADFDLIGSFFLREIPELHPKTRGIIVSSFTGLADIFLRGKFRRIFCSGESTLTPEQSWADQKNILIINLPIDVFQESGRLAQLLIKRCFQRAVQARAPSENQRPVLCVIDEVQYLLDAEADLLFTSNCRSKGVVNIWLSQGIDAIYAACGGGPKGEQIASAILANLANKVLLKQDGNSAVWASKLIGDAYTYLDYGGGALAPSLMSGGGHGGASKQLQPRVLPSAFFNLKSGGDVHDFLVSGYVWSGGSNFSHGEPHLKVEFSQKLELEGDA